MRQITSDSIEAFEKGLHFSRQNMRVERDETHTFLMLHGNTIARKNIESGLLEITTAGWDTVTTRARLNGLPGVRVWKKNHQLFLATPEFPCGIAWDGFWIAVN